MKIQQFGVRQIIRNSSSPYSYENLKPLFLSLQNSFSKPLTEAIESYQKGMTLKDRAEIQSKFLLSLIFRTDSEDSPELFESICNSLIRLGESDLGQTLEEFVLSIENQVKQKFSNNGNNALEALQDTFFSGTQNFSTLNLLVKGLNEIVGIIQDADLNALFRESLSLTPSEIEERGSNPLFSKNTTSYYPSMYMLNFTPESEAQDQLNKSSQNNLGTT